MLFQLMTLLLVFVCYSIIIPEKNSYASSLELEEQQVVQKRADIENYYNVISSSANWHKRQRKSSHRRKRSEVKVCYPEIGCFYETGYIDILPNSPEEINTKFQFYNSKKFRGDTPLLDISAQNISSLWKWTDKAINVSAPTKVIIHGFGSSCSNIWVYEMRSALMSAEECNVICVDWESGAPIPNYVQAAANTRIVGKQVAMLISGLQKHVNLSVGDVHMIGFSLGAHVAGFAGSELKNLSRITGLDPAGPLFESQDRRARLDSTDANFVDVIHSNGENLILGGLGAWQPMGHVDFYPNGGRMQKGCTNLFVGAVSDMIWAANEVYGRSLCNHRRAYKFFTDSISLKCQFPAVPCESYDYFLEGKCFPCKDMQKCGNMGYYADKYNGTGKLYLLTRDEEPLCAHQYLIKVESSAKLVNSEKIVTYGKIQIMLIGDLELNETFTITQKKDEKLVSGDVFSKIIVPHPALQNFYHVQIIYTAYNGWLSTGHQHWSINKVSLTDSYNQKLSVCKDELLLESGVPFTLPLYPGDCVIHKLDTNKTVFNNDAEINEVTTDNISISSSSSSRPEIGEYVTYLKKPNDNDSSDIFNDSWTPLYYYKDDYVQQESAATISSELAYDDCDDNCSKSGTVNNLIFATNLSSSEEETLLCPSLRRNNVTYDDDRNDIISSDYNCIIGNRNGKKIKINSNSTTVATNNRTTINLRRSHNNNNNNNSKITVTYVTTTTTDVNSEHLNPPLVEATESWKYWKPFPNIIRSSRNITSADDVRKISKSSSGYFIVQFLPERLMSFLQKAENYVKLALVPYRTVENSTVGGKYFSLLYPDTSVVNSENNFYNNSGNSNNHKHNNNNNTVLNRGRRMNSARSSLRNKQINNDSAVTFVPVVSSKSAAVISSNTKYIPLYSYANDQQQERS